MIISVLGNVAEMERSNMLERQRQGHRVVWAKALYRPSIWSQNEDNEVLTKYKTVVKELEMESLRRAAKLAVAV
jgi:DNA invertase Pin-like site-specific DNA recombinase